MQAESIFKEINDLGLSLVAVTKTKSVDDIQELYNLGIRDMGENRVQELMEKVDVLPADIRWHAIGHLQKNKFKFIAPFVYMIHSVDSIELLNKIEKEAQKNDRVIQVLLQFKVAQEESKFGIAPDQKDAFLRKLKETEYKYIQFRGIMGMASFTDIEDQIKDEFRLLKSIFEDLKKTYFEHQINFDTLSMGMSSDWRLAVEEGSTLLRIGSALFRD